MLTKTELAILRIVSNTDIGIGWHGIATKLSNVEGELERSNMMGILKNLTERELLAFDTEKKAWMITSEGLLEIS